MIFVIATLCLQTAPTDVPSSAMRFFATLKVSVVSDPFPALPFVPVLDPKRKPEELLREFALKNGKSLEKVDTLFVLRDQKPRAADRNATEPGVLTVRRFPALALGDLPTPAQSVSLSAPNASLEQVAETLRKTALWDVQVASALRGRRVFLQVSQVSVGDLLQGLGRLADAGPRVLLETTSIQKAMQADAENSTPEKWKRRMRASEALREDVEKLLTPEQKEKNGKGEYVRIGLSEMSPALREKALEYIKLAVEISSEAFGTELDLSQVSQFGLRFCPPQAGLSWRQLGVHVVGTDGYECFM
jgi:hypothetical protein